MANTSYGCRIKNVYAKNVGLVNDVNDYAVHGIVLACHYAVVEDCYLENVCGHGIVINESNNNNIVRGCTIINPNYKGAFTEGIGISLYSTQGNMIIENHIEDNLGHMAYGIREWGTSNKNIITNNRVIGATTQAIATNNITS